MNIDRAIEILDPTHREQYDSIEEVNEACLIGMYALRKMQANMERIDEEMNSTQREMTIYESAVNHFGANAQIEQTIEEMAELTVALNKYKRFISFGHGNEAEVMENIAQERADVEIMLNQLQVIFGDCSEWECKKLERLARMIEDAGGDGAGST